MICSVANFFKLNVIEAVQQAYRSKAKKKKHDQIRKKIIRHFIETKLMIKKNCLNFLG